VSDSTRLTWRALHAEAAERLGSKEEARRLVERASGLEGSEYVLGLDQRASARAEPFFRAMLERRAAGEPLQYVIGQWGFRRLDLYVDRRVLIPRPETEMVVQVALGELPRLGAAPVIVDLGTGSGAIALSLAVEVPSASVWATDRSAEALVVARANLAGIGRDAARVRVQEGSWFGALPDDLQGGVQLVISNPPYIADAEELPPVVEEWEPAGALRAGPTGLEDVATIVAEAPVWLAHPGALVVEIAPHQADQAMALARTAGLHDIEVRLDLAGRRRVLVARQG